MAPHSLSCKADSAELRMVRALTAAAVEHATMGERVHDRFHDFEVLAQLDPVLTGRRRRHLRSVLYLVRYQGQVLEMGHALFNVEQRGAS